MNMKDLRKLIIEKESVDAIGRGVELFFFEIAQKIMESPLPSIYHAGFVVDFKKGKTSYNIASLFRENEANSNSIIVHLINKIAKMYGFKYVVPLSRDSIENKQLAASLAYDFEAVYVKINLREAKLPTSIFGDWQKRTVESIEKHIALGKAANEIEQVVINRAYEHILECSRSATIDNPNFYRKISLDLNQYLSDEILMLFNDYSSKLCSILEERFINNNSIIEITTSSENSGQGSSSYSDKVTVPSVNCELTVCLGDFKVENVDECSSDIAKSDYKESKESVDNFIVDFSRKFNS